MMDWDENQHQQFYQSLKNMAPPERSQAALNRARQLLQNSRSADDLKAVESVLIYWKLNLRNPEDQDQANAIFYHLYQRMDDPERAREFKPLNY